MIIGHPRGLGREGKDPHVDSCGVYSIFCRDCFLFDSRLQITDAPYAAFDRIVLPASSARHSLFADPSRRDVRKRGHFLDVDDGHASALCFFSFLWTSEKQIESRVTDRRP